MIRMFTGIVEELGTVRAVTGGGIWGSIEINGCRVLEGTREGDSIAVNGVCLTVTRIGAGCFTADVMAETMRRSNLGSLKSGDPVNLERAMAADGRFGGHMVSGHIDGVGAVMEQKREGNAVWVKIRAQASIMELIIEKGSVAVDGVSLTVAAVSEDWFQVSVIPHTAGETTLLSGRNGRLVNLENDVVGKYVKKLLGMEHAASEKGGLTLEFLAENGF